MPQFCRKMTKKGNSGKLQTGGHGPCRGGGIEAPRQKHNTWFRMMLIDVVHHKVSERGREREREQLVCVCLSFGCPMIRMIRLAVSRLSHQECENGRTRSCAACEEGMVPVLYGSVLAYLIGQFLVLASLRKLSFFFPMLRVFEHHSNLQCYHVLPLMAATLEHGDRILNQWALRWHPLGLQMYPYNPL